MFRALCNVAGQHHHAAIVRFKHSSTQVNRLFKKNPARSRVESRMGIEHKMMPLEPRQFPSLFDVKFLPNGWSAPPPKEDVPLYPFSITRTQNKPNDGTGFLPVYSKFRKDGSKATTLIKRVSGDRDMFLSELRTVLELPQPYNPKDDQLRARAGGTTVEIDGNRVREVKQWLAGLGF